jgi:SAM-dependent methyltransferase
MTRSAPFLQPHPQDERLSRKPALRLLYAETYSRYAECLSRCPADGLALEIGSGAGFVKEIVPSMATSDFMAFGKLDLVFDAVRMPFRNSSLRLVCMLNVFHHVYDPEQFLGEIWRTLRPSGRLFIVDQHPGWPARIIYRYGHGERFDMQTPSWNNVPRDAAVDANGANPWIIFQRDLTRFERRYPGLKLVRYQPHTPWRYWLAGGLKKWSLLPERAFGLATRIDEQLIRLSPNLGSFVDVELVKTF